MAILPLGGRPSTDGANALRQTSQKLEVLFLSEMLKPLGAGAARTTFGGGVGEEQFSSFFVEEEAKAMVKSGGIGLAERIFQSLVKQNGGVDGPDSN